MLFAYFLLLVLLDVLSNGKKEKIVYFILEHEALCWMSFDRHTILCTNNYNLFYSSQSPLDLNNAIGEQWTHVVCIFIYFCSSALCLWKFEEVIRKGVKGWENNTKKHQKLFKSECCLMRRGRIEYIKRTFTV